MSDGGNLEPYRMAGLGHKAGVFEDKEKCSLPRPRDLIS
jgi:hypothetical protein